MANSELVPQPARYAVFVDAGYLYAASGAYCSTSARAGNTASRQRSSSEPLTAHAAERIRGELLRIYWFDAAPRRQPTVDQRVIANLPLVKLRLGNLNAQGQQKGVDAQLRADLEALARHRAITDAVLLAGDEDMLPAVEAAQRYGVRVHLWGVEPTHGSNQAEWLVWESDTVEVLSSDFLRPYFSKAGVLSVPAVEQPRVTVRTTTTTVPSPSQVFAGRTPAPLTASPKPSPATMRPASAPPSEGKLGPERHQMLEIGEHVAQKWIFERGRDNIRDLLPGPILPPVIDKELLIEAEKELGRRCARTRRPVPGCATVSGNVSTASSASASAARTETSQPARRRPGPNSEVRLPRA
jgi:Uncharacterized conserved protein